MIYHIMKSIIFPSFYNFILKKSQMFFFFQNDIDDTI